MQHPLAVNVTYASLGDSLVVINLRGPADTHHSLSAFRADLHTGGKQLLLRKRWLLPVLVVGAVLACSQYRRRDLARTLENLRRYFMPNTALCDAWAAPVLGGFFAQVAKELTELAPQTPVIEIGSGPGLLATKLAQIAPDIQATGIDISPEMVERANSLAKRHGVADRVEFRVGDVASLPFPDASFDVVVSTFSFHHWTNQARGLAEIYRVLRPGGTALIYDFADWIRRFERRGPGITEPVKDSPFGERGACRPGIAIRLGPIPLVYRAELRREESSAGTPRNQLV